MILVLNTGSSSIKAAVFDGEIAEQATATLTGLGNSNGRAVLEVGGVKSAVDAPDHAAGIGVMLEALGAHPFSAVAHRVVHGGTALVAPTKLDAHKIKVIEANVPLAPLHNPPALAGIAAIASARPDLPQYASFDTAFHATNPAVATTYAIPQEDRDLGLRRYGFHGLSYAWMVNQFGAALPDRLLAFHLGNGASLCAIKAGRSTASSMGYSPLDGLTMGTRSGAIDGMAVLRMAEIHGADEASRRLNKDSGLKGLGGANDMRLLLAADTDDAKFAVDHFCYWAARHAGSAVVAMGGVDAVAFTGGIGENSAEIRTRIMAHLKFLGEVPVHVIKADEERQIALDATNLGAA
ncbi:acetate kinase [Octadecabacter temperatus]|uniref:Acetate kinase n=1 Tax=Octadecabacter temperatus TaxID=1458307 RepID=A0A0K0Y8L9_9RHOB|nr:acetate kinase [Octadecabacter temperatus]AKS47319.1 Acetate kinase [Octadecabacter temperatus]SIO44040.1 acetate kinase [Octadecabacter temperatus]